MKPFSTYPEDRAKLLELAGKCERSDDADANELGDMVRAILEDEEVAITLRVDEHEKLRDFFAAHALSGFMASTKRPTTLAPDDATWCYTIADAMLVARATPTQVEKGGAE